MNAGNFLSRFAARVYEAVSAMRWSALAALLAAHAALCWTLLAAAGEGELTSPAVFPYYYAVTASTIGYGDFSPKGFPGRMAVALVAIPGGLALFGAFIGKAVADAGERWRTAMQGRKSYADLVGHTVVLGWHPERGPRLVGYLAADPSTSTAIVVVAAGLAENPVPDKARFVSAATLSSADALERSGVANACVAIVDGGSDETTLTTGLAIAGLARRPRIVASFEDEEKARLFERNVPNSECTVALASEMLARSARDPGSSDMQRRMLSLHDDDTQFSAVVPPGGTFAYGRLFSVLRTGHRAVAIGLMREVGHPDVNPPDERRVEAGDAVFYIAPRRLDAQAWGAAVLAAREGGA